MFSNLILIIMKKFQSFYSLLLIAFTLVSCSEKSATLESQSEQIPSEEITELKMQNLMKESLALAEGVEVVVSYLEVPKNTTFPRHTHPGEEFAFVVEGSGFVQIGDGEKIALTSGKAEMVPFKKEHTFSTEEESAKIVVFRVHEKGQPERTLVK